MAPSHGNNNSCEETESVSGINSGYDSKHELVCGNITHATMRSSTTMTRTTEPNETHETAMVIRSVTDEHEQIINEMITVLEEENPELESQTITIKNTEWELDNPCPHCGSTMLNTIRGREEESEYNTTTETMEYKGLYTGTAILQTDIIAVICNECSEVLWETLEHHTLSYQCL
jgi:predicted RNA-binding Zn-ribbon protein involved in translation (DUF1610 family)